MNRRFLALAALVVIAAVAVFALRPTEPTLASGITPEQRAYFEQAAIELNVPVESIVAMFEAGIEAPAEAATGTMGSGPTNYEKAVTTCYRPGSYVGWAAYGPCGTGANGNVCIGYQVGFPAVAPYMYMIQCQASE